MTELLGSVAAPEITKILWGFTPKDTAGCAMAPLEEDDNACLCMREKRICLRSISLCSPCCPMHRGLDFIREKGA